MTRPLVVDGRAVTVRVAVVDGDTGESRDLGRVLHEVTAVELFEHLPERDTDDDSVIVVELWEENEWVRWLRDEREIEREIADVLLDGHLDELLASA